MKKMTGLCERSSRWWKLLNVSLLLVSVTCPLPTLAQAGNNDGGISAPAQTLKDGRHVQESKETRQITSINGESVQLKFSHCVLKAQQASAQKAIACFQQLVLDYPELSEAYNNIGVLYAGMGMQVEARKWFERGLKQRQVYATLHQNLLNLQSEITRNAYAAALQLDISKSNAQPKLSLLAKITSVPEVIAPVASMPPAITSSKSANDVSASAESSMGKRKLADTSTVSSSAAEAPAIVSANSAQQERVREAIVAWALAWGKKDLDGYFNAYASSFNPGANLSRSAWQEQRRDRIMSKKHIHIELSDFNISFSKGKATAKFIQSYQSGSIVTVSRKTLELSEDKGQWLITREFVSGN